MALSGLAVWVAVAPAASQNAPTGVTIKTVGVQTFHANKAFTETLRFAPGSVTIRSGGTLTLAHGPGDKSQDPHTLTIVNKRDLPNTGLAVSQCGEGGPRDPCSLADGNHMPSPGHPHGAPFVDVGQPGLNVRGDSMSIPPTGPHGAPVAAARLTVKVTAAPGSTLYFLCAVHAWMQGSIHVE